MYLWHYFCGLALFLVLSSMLLTLPHQVGILRSLDRELQLAEDCESGSENACRQLKAPEELSAKVKRGTASWDGTCLFLSEEGLAVRAGSGHVSDVVFA